MIRYIKGELYRLLHKRILIAVLILFMTSELYYVKKDTARLNGITDGFNL